MSHPTNDELLLLAYGELAREAAAGIESHVANCVECRRELATLERARVALTVATPTKRAPLWIALTLAAAAVLAGVVITKSGVRDQPDHWTPTTTWSATAGYVAGGSAMIDIDAQLTRLEQELPHARP